MTDEHAERALRRLVDEARADAVPELDFAAIESSLLARAARGDHGTRLPTRVSRLPWLLAAAAVALVSASALVLRTGSHGSNTTPPSVTALAASGTTTNGDLLPVGAIVTAGADPVVVEHAGHVTWTLERESLAHVEGVGEVIALSLDRGALSAHVVKSTRPESFAVRVERTRVAVHGTAFRVERLESTVKVEVTEGVVAIGPVGGPAFELVAPGTVVVSLEGARAEVPSVGRSAVGPTAKGRAEPSQPPKDAPALAKTEEARGEPPAEGAPEVDRVIQVVRHCLGEHTVARGDLRVTVRTRMALRVQPDGRITEALFDPPLAPRVKQCVDAEVGAIRFEPSRDGFALDRAIELDR